MVATYHIKLFRMVADRHNGILMSLLQLGAEATSHLNIVSYNTTDTATGGVL